MTLILNETFLSQLLAKELSGLFKNLQMGNIFYLI